MAFPTAVNDQVTDSITQSNVKVVGESPAVSMGTVYQTSAHSIGLSFENAVNNQAQQNILANSAITTSVAKLLGEK